MLLNWQMSALSGEQVVEVARYRGVNRKRGSITLGSPADDVHRVFDRAGCLAVIEKGVPEHQTAFRMILQFAYAPVTAGARW